MNPVQNKLDIWRGFCNKHKIFEHGVPLFQTQGGIVEVFRYGTNKRYMLKRSYEMECLVQQQVEVVVDDFNTDIYDGLIYIMFWKQDDQVIPLYIGKAETYGKKGRNLSENLKGDSGKFSRWGYNYAYHIGDLSAVVCPGHQENKKTRKYEKWAKVLFESYPTLSPKLKRPTYFWISPWSKSWTSVWEAFGATTLTFLEYLLIGLASEVYPDTLLNEEGVNRK